MNTTTFQPSRNDGVHQKLNTLAGNWKGTTRTWFEPGVLADESPIQGSINPILGGRFMLHEYSGSLQGKPLGGFVIYGYALAQEQMQPAWIDSFHMGTEIMFSEGPGTNGGFHITGTYKGGDETWSWRTEIDMPNTNELIITAFNIAPDGAETKATETTYQRV